MISFIDFYIEKPHMFKNKLILFIILFPSLTSHATTTGIDQSILNQNKQEHRQLIQDIENQKTTFTKTDNYQDLNINLKDWKEETPCFTINQFELISSNKKLLKKFKFILNPLTNKNKPTYAINRCIGQHNLQNIIYITQNELLKNGYITSQIYIPDQDLLKGVLKIGINFGKISRFSPERPFINGAIPLKQNDILNLQKLEQGLEALKRIDPKTNIAIIADEQKIGYSQLDIHMDKNHSFSGTVGIDNSLQKQYGTYLVFASMTANNPLKINDQWQFSVNYPLKRLVNKYQGKTFLKVGQNRQLNYQIGLNIPYGNYKMTLSHSLHEYKNPVAGFNNPLLYHGQATTSTLGLTRLIYRNQSQKTEGYTKVYHKKSKHFIDDIEISVQNRQTAGYHLGITHQKQLNDGAFIYANIDYKHGTAMLKAKPAPEEEIYNAFGEKLPAEGFARSPIWSWYVEYNKPWQISGQNLQYNLKVQGQYATKLPTPNDLYYIGGRGSVRGFKEGDYLTGEHGFSLQQELIWQIPNAFGKQQTQGYIAFDQGRVAGEYSRSDAKKLLGAAIGARHYHKNISLDGFVARGLYAPNFIAKETVFGVSAQYQF